MYVKNKFDFSQQLLKLAPLYFRILYDSFSIYKLLILINLSYISFFVASFISVVPLSMQRIFE